MPDQKQSHISVIIPTCHRNDVLGPSLPRPRLSAHALRSRRLRSAGGPDPAKGGRTTLLCDILEQGEDLPERERRHQSAFKCFSWQQLQPEYVEKIQECASV